MRYWKTTVLDIETGQDVAEYDSREDCPGGDATCGGCGSCCIAQMLYAEEQAKRRFYRFVGVECHTEQDGAPTWVDVPVWRHGTANPDRLRRWSLDVAMESSTLARLTVQSGGPETRNAILMTLTAHDEDAPTTFRVAIDMLTMELAEFARSH